MEFITENLEGIIAVVTAIVTLASAVANLTKTESDNKVVAKIGKVVDVLALNLKKNG